MSDQKRARRSTASKILRDLKEESMEEGCYLVLYDFQVHPQPAFYRNLEEIQGELQDGERIQRSVVQCKYARTAKAIKALCTHYKAEALIFKVMKVVN